MSSQRTADRSAMVRRLSKAMSTAWTLLTHARRYRQPRQNLVRWRLLSLLRLPTLHRAHRRRLDVCHSSWVRGRLASEIDATLSLAASDVAMLDFDQKAAVSRGRFRPPITPAGMDCCCPLRHQAHSGLIVSTGARAKHGDATVPTRVTIVTTGTARGTMTRGGRTLGRVAESHLSRRRDWSTSASRDSDLFLPCGILV